MKTDSRGAAGLAVVLGILLIAVVGYAGYSVFIQEDETDISDVGDYSDVLRQTDTEESEPIESSSDIDNQLSEIEDIDLDSEFDTSSLEEDISDL